MKTCSLGQLAAGLLLALAACAAPPTVAPGGPASATPAIPAATAGATPTNASSPQPSVTPLPTPSPTPAAAPIGDVERKTDVVEHGSTADTLSQLQGTASLFQGDVLKLHDGGEGLLNFGNQLTLQLFNDSQLGVVSSSAPGTPLDIQIALEDGGFTGQLTAPGGKAVFTTPGGAQITVLGTDFLVAYDPATNVTTAGNFHGTVQVASGGVQIALGSGNAVVVPANQPPGVQVPIAFSLEQFQQQARLLKSPVQAAGQYVSLAGSTALAVSDNHACVLTTDGGVKCWGSNDEGQLGSAEIKSSAVPVAVADIKGRAVQVAMASVETCAATQDGQAQCWGANTDTTIEIRQSARPLPLSWPSGPVAAVAPGNGFTCVLTVKGGVKCVGKAPFGQLGDGSLTSGVLAITTGLRDHTCALLAGGHVKCWGFATHGELGNGQDGSSETPVDVAGLDEPVTSVVAGGSHTCALTLSGGVKCWGYNSDGQLGNASVDQSNVPVDVDGLTSGVRAITASHNHTCALTTAGGVKCWGSDHLGDGKTISSPTPIDVAGLQGGVAAIAAGGPNTCALMTSGGVKCWGDNTFGQLGDGTTTSSDVPVDVVGLGPAQ